MPNRNSLESDMGIRLSGGCCIVCGWNKNGSNGDSLVIGAHVRPWADGPQFDKFDNIIALCPNHHAEFDSFMFYINPDNMELVFRDKNDIYNGKNVSSSIKHIRKAHLFYRLNQYRNHSL